VTSLKCNILPPIPITFLADFRPGSVCSIHLRRCRIPRIHRPASLHRIGSRILSKALTPRWVEMVQPES
jgi:hypothetical protein